MNRGGSAQYTCTAPTGSAEIKIMNIAKGILRIVMYSVLVALSNNGSDSCASQTANTY